MTLSAKPFVFIALCRKVCAAFSFVRHDGEIINSTTTLCKNIFNITRADVCMMRNNVPLEE
jgi:hypothetical protein